MRLVVLATLTLAVVVLVAESVGQRKKGKALMEEMSMGERGQSEERWRRRRTGRPRWNSAAAGRPGSVPL